jgi:hypothetical protein
MSQSNIEEIISGIWALCAVCSFGFGFTTWGWIFGATAAVDTVIALWFAHKETLQKKAAA